MKYTISTIALVTCFGIACWNDYEVGKKRKERLSLEVDSLMNTSKQVSLNSSDSKHQIEANLSHPHKSTENLSAFKRNKLCSHCKAEYFNSINNANKFTVFLGQISKNYQQFIFKFMI